MTLYNHHIKTLIKKTNSRFPYVSSSTIRNQFKRYVYLNQTLKSIILCQRLKIIPLFSIDFTR
ncbi:hypothetical protein Hanom_Chr04g00364281 [Helianthus anomalus]